MLHTFYLPLPLHPPINEFSINQSYPCHSWINEFSINQNLHHQNCASNCNWLADILPLQRQLPSSSPISPPSYACTLFHSPVDSLSSWLICAVPPRAPILSALIKVIYKYIILMFSAQDLFVEFSLSRALKCVIFTKRSPTDACESRTSLDLWFSFGISSIRSIYFHIFLQFTSADDDAADLYGTKLNIKESH